MNGFSIANQGEIQQQTERTVAPTDQTVVSMDLLKKQCRYPLDLEDEEENITVYCKAAEELVEAHSETCLHQQSFRLDMQSIPLKFLPGFSNSMGVVRIERKPIISIDSIKLNLCDGTNPTLDTEFYNVYLSKSPPAIWIDPGNVHSEVNTRRLDAFQIAYTAGYPLPEPVADELTYPAIPWAARQAILFLVGTWFQKREAIHLWTGKPLMEMPRAYQDLIQMLSWRL